MSIELSERIKHQVAKGLVKAILQHAGYRVVNCGMEHIFREVSVLDDDEYKALGLAGSLRRMPDFLVADREMAFVMLSK